MVSCFPEIKPSKDWEITVAGIIKDPGTCMVLGGADSAKTSFIRYLAQSIPSDLSMAVVDTDIGQSMVSPPGTIGLAAVKDNSINEKPDTMYFVGSVSPTGYMLSFITGTRKILDYAKKKGFSLITVDTSGLVFGGAAKELKFRKIDIISPRHIIALQKDQELESILLPQEKRVNTTIWRIKTPEGIKKRTMEERQQCRKENFQNYFKDKKTICLPLKQVAIVGIVPDLGGNVVTKKEFVKMRLSRIETMQNNLVGINDGNNFTLAVGIIAGVNCDAEEIIIEAPDFDHSQARIVQFSSIKLDNC